ncbi:MAG: hypothetical protein WAT81_03560 [Candidatus Moraniibacteriota bacterium]
MRTPILLSQQRFDFGGGIALALAFFYQHSEELIKNPKPIVCGLVAKPSKFVGDSLEERVILIAILGGGSGAVTIRRQPRFSLDDELTNDQWWVASAYGCGKGLGQIDWKPKQSDAPTSTVCYDTRLR